MTALIFMMKLSFCLIGILLILLILARKSEGGGLTSAFGGAGGSEAFGVKATKQLDKVIAVMATMMFLLAILLNVTRPSSPLSQYSELQLKKSNTPVEESSNNK